MKKNRILALTLIAALLLTLLAGCGVSPAKKPGTTAGETVSGTGDAKQESSGAGETAETAPQETPAPSSEPQETEPQQAGPEPEIPAQVPGGYIPAEGESDFVLLIVKDYGSIVIKLVPDTAPITVANFKKLVAEGFYDGLTFHRVYPGFMIQGGDPDGTGNGGSPDKIKGEFSANGVENSLSHTRGTVSMARASYSMDSASSQFFICQQDSEFLDGQYAAFGYVFEGMETVDKICGTELEYNSAGELSKPLTPVVIEKALFLELVRDDGPQPEDTEAEDTETQPEKPAPTEYEPEEGAPDVTAADCIKEVFVESGTYYDGWGNEYVVDFRIPGLTCDSIDAQDLNSEIHRNFYTAAQEALDSLKAGNGTGLYKIEWEFYGHGEWFSLLIHAQYDYSWDEYAAYNFDQITGRLMTNEEVLQYCGLTPEQFESEAFTFMSGWFDDSFSTAVADGWIDQIEYSNIKKSTLDGISPYTNIFLDGDWNLQMILDVYGVAGAEYYTQVIPFPLG